MHLPGLSKFTSKKQTKENPREYIALQIGKSTSKAAVWVEGTEPAVKKLVKAPTPSDALSQVLADTSAREVILGLPDDFIEGSAIKESHLPELKRIADEGGIAPIGFVVTHEAIANLLEKEHEAPQTGLFAGFEQEKIVVSLYRGGICKKNIVVSRTSNIFQDFEKAILSFSSEEILPSKIILYNEGKSLDDIREQLLSYPWQQNDKFLHVPKIEALSWEYSIQAIVYAGENELANAKLHHEPDQKTSIIPPSEPVRAEQGQDSDATDQHEHAEQTPSAVDEQKVDNTGENTDTTISINDNAAIPAENDPPAPLEKKENVQHDSIIPDNENTMGFMHDTDILNTPPPETPVPTAQIPQQQPIAENAPHPPSRKPRIMLPSLRPPHSLSIRGTKALVPVALFLIAGIAAVGSAVYAYPKATVELLAQPKIVESEMEVTLNTTIEQADLSNKQIPGRVHSVAVLGSKSKEATGTKTIGEKATGTVTVFNKSTSSKTLTSGTVLSASSTVSFTLDNDISIASASDTGESLEYGKTDTSVTASTIGPKGNIKKDTELSVEDFSDETLSAKANDDFSGGTEREITVVSQEDITSLESQLIAELKDQASEQMKGQVLASETFIGDTLKENIVEKKYDKKSGDESDNVSLELDLEVSQTSYREEDIKGLLNALMQDKITEGFKLDEEKSYVSVISAESTDDEQEGFSFTASYTAFLLPDIETTLLNKELVGKSPDALTSFVRTLTDKNIVGYEIRHERKLPFYPNLPLRTENLSVKVVPF